MLPLVTLAVLYLEFKSSSRITGVWFIPWRLAYWFERHDFLKNLIGFGLWVWSGLLALPNPTRQAGEVATSKSGWCGRGMMTVAVFMIIIVAMELVQLRMPGRTCDWRDMLAGWLGAWLAWAVVAPVRCCLAWRNDHHPAQLATVPVKSTNSDPGLFV